MKKIIDGVTYDTDKDEFLFGYRAMLFTSYYYKMKNGDYYEYKIIGLSIIIHPVTEEQIATLGRSILKRNTLWLSKPSERALKYGI